MASPDDGASMPALETVSEKDSPSKSEESSIPLLSSPPASHGSIPDRSSSLSTNSASRELFYKSTKLTQNHPRKCSTNSTSSTNERDTLPPKKKFGKIIRT